MAKSYGKKIKRSKNLYKRRKTKLRVAIEIIVTLAVASSLVFVGFTVGKVVFDYFENADRDNPDPVQTTTGEQEGNNTDTSTQGGEEQTTTEAPQPNNPSSEGKITVVPISALQNTASLSAYITQIKSSGFESAVIELKDSTGTLWYKSGLENLQDKDFVKGGLTLAQIKNVFDEVGVEPIVKLYTLQDKTAPSAFSDISYRFADGSNNWLDDTRENGGKLWANPFLAGTRNYLSSLAGEIDSAGFKRIILTGTVFPNMTGYDISILPPQVSNKDTRHTALAEIYKVCAEKCKNSAIYIEVMIIDAVENYAGFQKTAEIFKSRNDLNDAAAVIVLNRTEIGTEIKTGTSSSVSLPIEAQSLVSTLYKQAARNLSPTKIIPCITGSEYTAAELEAVIKVFEESDLKEYIIK